MLEDMVEDAKKSCSLADLRLMTACLLAYASFMRFNKQLNIRPCDIKIHDKKWSCIFYTARQISYIRKGDKLVIVRTHKKTCPVAMLESYLSETGTLLSDQRWLFRPICKSNKSKKLTESDCVSYSCLRDLFKKKLKDLGHNPDKFSLHSLRAGGARAAVNSRVPDCLFK